MSSSDDCNQMVDCMQKIPPSLRFCCSNTLKTSDLADMMQLGGAGSELALNEAKGCEEKNGTGEDGTVLNLSDVGKSPVVKAKNKRKRARAAKTSEEVERQRMTHIAVERNRRKQMNEHLQILRSLMPTSYLHRGDQASIVGGAIEFVRELEQLLQCLESVKRRQLYGDEHDSPEQQQSHQEPLMLPTMPVDTIDMDETAESRSCLADVEVKLSGLFGLIKILSERRQGQLIKNIAVLEHLQLHILETNVTTIEHNVLCSFTVKINGEAMFTAEDIANSIQQMLSSVHASSSSI